MSAGPKMIGAMDVATKATFAVGLSTPVSQAGSVPTPGVYFIPATLPNKQERIAQEVGWMSYVLCDPVIPDAHRWNNRQNTMTSLKPGTHLTCSHRIHASSQHPGARYACGLCRMRCYDPGMTGR